jgi:hypothetical protein
VKGFLKACEFEDLPESEDGETFLSQENPALGYECLWGREGLGSPIPYVPHGPCTLKLDELDLPPA